MKQLFFLLVLSFSINSYAVEIFTTTYNVKIGITVDECVSRLEKLFIKNGIKGLSKSNGALILGTINGSLLTASCVDFSGKTNDSATGNYSDGYAEGFVMTSMGDSISIMKATHKALDQGWKDLYPINFNDMNAAHNNLKKLHTALSAAFESFSPD